MPTKNLILNNFMCLFCLQVEEFEISFFKVFLFFNPAISNLVLVLWLCWFRIFLCFQRGVLTCRPIQITLHFCFLYSFTKHKNGSHLVFLNHPPKVVDCRVKRTLSCNTFVPTYLNKIGIHIVFWLFFFALTSKEDPVFVEGQDSRITISRKMLWIFVQFFNMVFCLCYVRNNAKLTVEIALHLLEPELLEIKRLKDGLHGIALLCPFFRNVRIHVEYLYKSMELIKRNTKR